MAPRRFTVEEYKELTMALQKLGLSNSPYVEVYNRHRSRQNGGYGLFAREKIRRGTPIIVEESLFWITSDDQITARAAQHPRFHQLHCPSVSPTQQVDQRRFAANCFEMGFHGRGNRTVKKGIFLEASRLNHSCVPNAYFDWHEDLAGPGQGRLAVYAIIDIERNEEILVNYGAQEDSSKLVATRQQEFQDVYDFTCTCRACVPGTDFARQGEQCRTRLPALYTSIAQYRDFNTRGQREGLYSSITAVHQCLLANDTVYPQRAEILRELASYYHRWLSQAQGYSDQWLRETRVKAIEAARESLYLDIVCTGSESDTVGETLRLIERLK